MINVDEAITTMYGFEPVAFIAKNIRMLVCQNCGRRRPSKAVDCQINVALRKFLNLLTPNEMSMAMNLLVLTPSQIAERLGVVTRQIEWLLNGEIVQSRAVDHKLRQILALD
jgi:hypothetical protein